MNYFDTSLLTKSIKEVDSKGYCVVDLANESLIKEGKEYFQLMDKNYSYYNRKNYFNEFGFNWTSFEMNASKKFHNDITNNQIKSLKDAIFLFNKIFGEKKSIELISFLLNVKEFCLNFNRNLILSRVIIRQFNESESSPSKFTQWHEDIGYENKPYLQYLTAAITLYGNPTLAKRYNPKIGELLIFINCHTTLLIF